LREDFRPIAYTAPAQLVGASPGGPVVIRSRLPQAGMVAAVKRVLNEIDPSITVSFQGFKPMIEETILRERLLATISGFFGLLALLLACIGLYGVLSYGVACRTNEIGIRLSLGAGRRDVFWLILREALWLAIAGVAVGLPIIFAGASLASTLLFGLTPTDPVSLLLAALLMLAVAMVACWIPARRATKVDPLQALRHE
jgi:ABC-type antimicrobial peptide transport system permease subunit